MKKLLTILCLVLLSVHSYSQDVIPEVETVTREGLVYHQLSTEPLTGTVVSFYDNGRLQFRTNYKDGKQDGLYERFHCTSSKYSGLRAS
jgi:antitoxin component YwqK of YwqJK toxin-antitoxin module